MYDVGMVVISGGNRMRGNLFTRNMGDMFGSNPGVPDALRSPYLGQTGVGNFTQTKANIARWDALVERLRRIANQSVREQLASEFGINNPANENLGQYTRDRAAQRVAQAEASTPINYEMFAPTTPGPAKNDARHLEAFLTDFQAAIQNAEGTYGLLQTPQVITNTVSTTPGWVLPVAIGAGALGLLGLLGVIKF